VLLRIVLSNRTVLRWGQGGGTAIDITDDSLSQKLRISMHSMLLPKGHRAVSEQANCRVELQQFPRGAIQYSTVIVGGDPKPRRYSEVASEPSLHHPWLYNDSYLAVRVQWGADCAGYTQRQPHDA
jgi:hypothetical protein